MKQEKTNKKKTKDNYNATYQTVQMEAENSIQTEFNMYIPIKSNENIYKNPGLQTNITLNHNTNSNSNSNSNSKQTTTTIPLLQTSATSLPRSDSCKLVDSGCSSNNESPNKNERGKDRDRDGDRDRDRNESDRKTTVRDYRVKSQGTILRNNSNTMINAKQRESYKRKESLKHNDSGELGGVDVLCHCKWNKVNTVLIYLYVGVSVCRFFFGLVSVVFVCTEKEERRKRGGKYEGREGGK